MSIGWRPASFRAAAPRGMVIVARPVEGTMRRVLWLVLLAACGGGDERDPEPSGSCVNVAGEWEVDGCGGDSCTIVQDGCAAALDCDSGTASYSGSVSGSRVSFAGRNALGQQASCSATVSGGAMSGSCTPQGLPSCSFTARRQ